MNEMNHENVKVSFMKVIKYFYILLFIGALISCKKLDEKPVSVFTTSQFYKTKEDAIAAVNSIYHAGLNNGGVTMYNRLIHQAVEILSDDAIASQRVTNADVRAMAAITYSTTNDRIDELWKEHYIAINRANIAIDRIPFIDMDATLRERLVNEAKFLRGLLYFNLVRLWGEVPLVLHEVTSLDRNSIHVAKSPVESVYTQIINDLTDAEKLPAFMGGADAGRATGGAAKALLSKVYLTKREWEKAAAKALEVINGPYGYDLFQDYADVFRAETKNGKEHIFSAQCKSFVNGQGNRLASSATPVGIPGIAAAGSDEPMLPATYELYSANDKRRDVTFFTEIVSPENGNVYKFPPRFFKYFDPSTVKNPTESPRNIPIIRFAEVLLIYAEAVNEVSGPGSAYDAINRVRKRAGLDPLSGLDQSSFREAVYLERRLELMFEFHRWFDLIRTKRMVSALHAVGKTNASEKHYLHPIPQREIDLNPKLEQNDLWK